MRRIGTIETSEQAKRFSRYLNTLQIPHKIEQTTNQDWGDDKYGEECFEVWIVNEEDFIRAKEELASFLRNPETLVYPDEIQEAAEEKPQTIPPPVQRKKSPVTTYIAALCVALFVWGALTPATDGKRGLAGSPKIQQELYFDWPAILEQNRPMPVWQGIYPKIVAALRGDILGAQLNEPLFEKIRQGEIWRLFSPALLHANLFHIFFNLMWLLAVGRQIEERIGSGRYLLFILMTGIFANVCQYLMSGFNFVGISGVLAAMLAYVWVRQKKAPWEGYQMQPGTFMLISIFILAMLGLQVLSFAAEVLADASFPLHIANTAHIAGAAIGYGLGYTNYFTWKKS